MHRQRAIHAVKLGEFVATFAPSRTHKVHPLYLEVDRALSLHSLSLQDHERLLEQLESQEADASDQQAEEELYGLLAEERVMQQLVSMNT